MNVEIEIFKKYVLLSYIPMFRDFESELIEAEKNGLTKGKDIKNTFFVDYSLYNNTLHLLSETENEDEYNHDDTFYFIIGEVVDDFYKLNKEVLKLDFDLFFQKRIKLDARLFVKSSGNGYSVFRAFNNFYHGESLYIVEEKDDETLLNDRLSISALKKCIELIPTQTEIQKYRYSRYTSSLINYLNVDDYELKLKEQVDKKVSTVIKRKKLTDEAFNEIELFKCNTYLSKLKEMLANYDKYNEAQWQIEILKIFRFINSKYIYIGEKIKLTSFVDGSPLFPDIVLIDYNGNIDLIEIKTPKFDLFYSTRYRKNFVPIRELQGTCMQIQNYLLSLMKTRNDALNQKEFKEKARIPFDFNLKSTYPKGYIIYGRDEQLADEKMKTDFQILRNMYANIIDIITYDDLIRRLENIIKSLE